MYRFEASKRGIRFYSGAVLTGTTGFWYSCHALEDCQARSSEENQTGKEVEEVEWHVTHTHVHTQNFTVTSAWTPPCSHAQQNTLSLFQSFFGWHFLGLLFLQELFTHPPSLPVSNTDLMGRGGGVRECNQADSWSEAAKQRVLVRKRDRLCGSGAATWISILLKNNHFHSNIDRGSIRLMWEKPCSFLTFPTRWMFFYPLNPDMLFNSSGIQIDTCYNFLFVQSGTVQEWNPFLKHTQKCQQNTTKYSIQVLDRSSHR